MFMHLQNKFSLMIHEHNTNQLNCLKFFLNYNKYVHYKISSFYGKSIKKNIQGLQRYDPDMI